VTDRVVVIAKRSMYSRFIEGEGDPHARELVRRRDPSVKNWRPAHRDHLRTLEAVQTELERLGVHPVLLLGSYSNFQANSARLVVTVGGDGTLLAASHNVDSVPILGVNSAPNFSTGFFCAARRENLRQVLRRALDGKLKRVVLTRMSVRLNAKVRSKRVLNEALFCHTSPAATSRYIIQLGKRLEEHRSSGIWIGPAAGSTAAQRSAGGRVLSLSSSALQLVVREPYSAMLERWKLLHTILPAGRKLLVRSKMHDACLFLDGPYKKIAVGLGDRVEFSASDEPLTVLGLERQR
jgi:NAD+ kinase